MTALSRFFDPGTAELLDRRIDEVPRHGDLPKWQAALDELPAVDTGWHIEDGVLTAGTAAENTDALAETLKKLIPWRKGPLRLGGVFIDTEWRSDWKWDRVTPNLDLTGKRVLDIGAGNGYFGWRMLDAGAEQVIGCDPTAVFHVQFRAIDHFAGEPNHLLLPLKFEQVPPAGDFDAVFSMGVLYHRKDPAGHLECIRRHMKPGAELVLETLVIPGDDDREFDPPDRYANMRNVHHLPTRSRLERWLSETGFEAPALVDVTPTSVDEQRATAWVPFHSLASALAGDFTTTIEGHTAPVRAIVIAHRA